MTPHKIHSKLSGLRFRERCLRLLWGLARVAAVVVAIIVAACFADWLVDRFLNTPQPLRVLFLGTTLLGLAVAFLVWVVLPLFHSLPLDRLALLVEEHFPALGHRLISAVQLNRKEAFRHGMSHELIGMVTQEAETQAAGLNFKKVADHRRVGWSAMVVVPALLVAAVPFLMAPSLSKILLARHFLQDVEIPRNIQIEFARQNIVVPLGEDFTVELFASSLDQEHPGEGILFVTPEGLSKDAYPLFGVFDASNEPEKDDKGRFRYQTTIRRSTVNLTCDAYLGDGRTKTPANIAIVPRPIITSSKAFVLLPEFCGLTPSGKRYSQEQSRGDIVGIPKSSARIIAEVQKPIVQGRIDILGPERAKKKDDEEVPEVVKRRIPMTIDQETGTTALAEFDLRENETSYRVIVTDSYGFENIPPLERKLAILPEEAPQVVLLKDYWTDYAAANAPLDIYEREGIPVPVGEAIRAPYVAYGPYGIGKAQFLFRVLKKTESAAEVQVDVPWDRLDLTLHKHNPEKESAFDARRGVFEKTKNSQSIEFYPVPSPNPERILENTMVGGRYHFQTKKALVGNQIVDLKEGDRIEYCLEVYPRNYNPKTDVNVRPVGKSETRVVTLGNYDDLKRWLKDTDDEFRRLKDLEKKQQKVFSSQ